MRRGSFVGPLILIGLGVLFLIRNVWPEIPILEFLARNWPYILIAWGALRLVELFTWRASNRPLPVSGVSGGEWTLVVLLCFFGMSLYQFQRRDSWWGPARVRVGGWEVFSDNFDFNYDAKTVKAASKTPRIVIESFRGDAQITGADTTEVKVGGRKSIRALDRNDAEKSDKDSPLEVVTQGDQIVIRLNQERADSRSRVTSRLEIAVPRGASIDARGRYGDFDIRDIDGAVEIYSDNAGVRLDNIGGNVRIDTRKSDIIRAVGIKGNVELKGRGEDIELENIAGSVIVNGGYSGSTQFRNLAKPVKYEGVNMDFQFEKVPGEVRSTISNLYANNVVGPIRVTSSKSKDIDLNGFTNGVEIQIDRGDILLRPGRLPVGKIDVSTKNGEVEFALPSGGKAEIKATTSNGDITNDLSDTLKIEGEARRSRRLTGSVGGAGGSSVVLHSNRGSITLRKGDTLPPPAPASPPNPPTKPEVRVE